MKTKSIGRITSGRIELGDGSTIKAGISGTGTAETDIRHWAGATFANRATAPFRVEQSGKVYATAGAIGGWNLATDAIFSGTKSTASGFSVSGITMASDGSIHAPRFYINADGTVGIRSNTTGKRIELNSTDNNIKFFNSSNQVVVLMDDGIEGSNAGVYFGYNSASGGYQSLLTNYALALIHNQYTKIRLFYDDTIDKSYIATESGRSALFLNGTAEGRVEVVFHGLPRSSTGLQPGQVYLDGSGYLRALAPSF